MLIASGGVREGFGCPLWHDAQLTAGFPAKNWPFRSETICIILRAVFLVSLSSLALSPIT
jgi:hypothetical protein